jgi:hypothetical protein
LKTKIEDEIINRIIEKYKMLEERFDYLLIEGTSFFWRGLAYRI